MVKLGMVEQNVTRVLRTLVTTSKMQDVFGMRDLVVQYLENTKEAKREMVHDDIS